MLSLNREFLSSSDGPEVIKNHFRSFYDLWYARDGRLQKFNMGPTGAMRIFIESNSSAIRGDFIAEDQFKYHEEQFSQGTWDPPVNFYRITFNGMTREDDESELAHGNSKASSDPRQLDAEIPVDTYTIQKPVFFGGSHNDPICVDTAQVAGARAFCPNLTVANFNTTHWIAAEAAKEVNEALDRWISEAVLA